MNDTIKPVFDSWVNTKLDNVCKILDSTRIPINAKERNSRIEGKKKEKLYPYYGATGEVGKIDGYLFDGEYLLLGEDSAPFLDYSKDTAYIATGKFWVNNHAHILKAHVSNKYLCHYLNQYDFFQSVTGTTRLKLNQSALKDIPVLFPPFKEQYRIVAKIEELFSELDKGIESLKTAREQLKVYRQALLKHAFEGKLTEQWRKDNADKLETADELLVRIQQERETRYQQQLVDWEEEVKCWEAEGKEGKKPSKLKNLLELKSKDSSQPILSSLPSNWIETYIDSFWALNKKPITTGPFGTALKKSEHKNEGEHVLGIENIGRGLFVSENKIFVDKLKAEVLSSFIVDSGDLIISRSGTVGEICEVPNEYDGAFISTNLIRVSLNRKLVLSEYFVYLFQGEGMVMQQVREQCKGSSRDFLNQTIVKEILFPIPSIEEQRMIIDLLNQYLSVSDQLDSEINDNLNRSEALRQSILKKAFTGQLVPQDPNDEPASELLKRIATKKSKLEKKMLGKRTKHSKTRSKTC